MDDDPRPHPSSSASLSPRERDILALLAADLSDREIASRLVVAYTTVKWHNRQIFNKLGVDNRRQAVERAFELGVFGHPEPALTANHNLPTRLTPFIGRAHELGDLSRLLSNPNTRLVTILAPGGMGKTRLALAAAANALRQFSDGVFFVPLAPVTSSDQLVMAIAEAIGFQFVADSRLPRQQLLESLRNKVALLVLDNFEHLLDGAAFVADILQEAPQVMILTTTRERLNLDGETLFRLGGLPYPAQNNEANLLDFGAAQLFMECARRANSNFACDDEASLVRICQLVQGMPLALELAAVWVGTLPLNEIVDEIAHSADFLHTTRRNIPERLRSVRAVFEATWRRLSDEERQIFRRLSVFRGGCTRDAAQVVAGAGLASIAGLVDKALLWHQTDSGRYEIHELLRQYAAEELDAAGEREATQDVHRDYFGRLAGEWGRALKTPKQLLALEVLEADHDNIREALARAAASRNPAVIEPFTDLWYFYEIRAWYGEAVRLFGAAIAALDDQESITLGKLLAAQGLFFSRLDQVNEQRQAAERSIEIFHRLGVEQESVLALSELGEVLVINGDLAGGSAVWREGLEIAQKYDDQWGKSIMLFLMGESARMHGQFDEAKRCFSQSHALVVRLGNIWGLGFTLRELARLAFEAGDYDEAQRLYEGALKNALTVHHVNAIDGYWGLSEIAFVQGNLPAARHYAEDGLKIADNFGRKTAIFYLGPVLVEIALAMADDQDAHDLLREMLAQFARVYDPNHGLELAVTAALYLARRKSSAELVTLLSFIKHHPQRYLLLKRYDEPLRTLADQLASTQPPDGYHAAWEAGQTLSVDDLLAMLYRLI